MVRNGLITDRKTLAVETLLKHLDALGAKIGGVRQAEDIESVHQMRVASRRLRNAMDLFEDVLPAGRYGKWLKQIKRVTRALGAARDTDVQIEAVRASVDSLKEAGDRDHRSGVERLLLRLGQQRRQLQFNVLKTMDRLEASGVLSDMRNTLLQMKVEARIHPAAEPQGGVTNGARQVIGLRLEQMLAYEHYVHAPEHLIELHAMRIAAKHLRYTLESYGPVYPDKLKWQIKLVKRIQTMLGDLHDCDVWIAYLPLFIERERKRHQKFFGHLRGFAKLARGAEHFRNDRQECRERLYENFVRFWDEVAASGRWDALVRSVDTVNEDDMIIGRVDEQTDEERGRGGA